MKRRKKIAALLSCMFYATSLAGWNVSDYEPYSLRDYKDVGTKGRSILRNFPNTVILYKKKGLPLDIMIQNAFTYYGDSTTKVGFGVHSQLVNGDGVEGVRMDILSYSNISYNRKYNGRTYYSSNVAGEDIPMTARYWINNEIDKSLEIPIYWEARIYSSSYMSTTYQKLIVKIPLQLKAFDIDFGQHFKDNGTKEVTTQILVDGEANSSVILHIENPDIELENGNGGKIDVVSMFSGSRSDRTVELGPNGEARVNIISSVKSSLVDSEAGLYKGILTITAKYI